MSELGTTTLSFTVYSPTGSSTASLFLFSPMKILAATPVSNDVSPMIAALLASLIPAPLLLRVRSPAMSPAADAAKSGGPIVPAGSPTLRSLTLFISRKNAAILSDGTFTVGCPALRVRATLLMGASTGGAVGLRLALADAKKLAVCLADEEFGTCMRVGGGGGGGGGGGIIPVPELDLTASCSTSVRER